MISNFLSLFPSVRRLKRELEAERGSARASKFEHHKNAIETSLTTITSRAAHLQAELDQLRGERNRTWVRSPQELTDVELRRAFDIETKAPLWQAVHQLLDRSIQDAVDDATAEPSATCTAEHRTFRNGGIDYLRKYQKELLDQQAAAQKVDDDIDPGKEKL